MNLGKLYNTILPKSRPQLLNKENQNWSVHAAKLFSGIVWKLENRLLYMAMRKNWPVPACTSSYLTSGKSFSLYSRLALPHSFGQGHQNIAKENVEMKVAVV